jgi:hypothetical protein
VGGSIFLADDELWSVASWLFDWTLRTIADEVGSGPASDQILEVDRENLGSLVMADFTTEDASIILDVIRTRLLVRAESEFSDDMVQKPSSLEALGKLAALVSDV